MCTVYAWANSLAGLRRNRCLCHRLRCSQIFTGMVRNTIHMQNAYMCENLVDWKLIAQFVRCQVTELSLKMRLLKNFRTKRGMASFWSGSESRIRIRIQIRDSNPDSKLTAGRIRIRNRIRNFCFGSATLISANTVGLGEGEALLKICNAWPIKTSPINFASIGGTTLDRLLPRLMIDDSLLPDRPLLSLLSTLRCCVSLLALGAGSRNYLFRICLRIRP